jgi:hypothetical protein
MRKGSPRWLRAFWAWLYPRLSGDIQPALPAPDSHIEPRGLPGDIVPVLGADVSGEGGALGFLRFASTLNTGARVENHGFGPARRAVEDVFHRHLDAPRVPGGIELMSGRIASGQSGGLAAACLTLLRLLDLEHDHDCAAVGAFSKEPDQFVPVEASTLAAKIKAARAFGYRKILVIEGQLGLPDDRDIEIIELPRSLQRGLPTILDAHCPGAAQERFATVLLAYETRVTRGPLAPSELDETLATSALWTDKSHPDLVRCVAHDLRSHVLRHAGRTAEAAAESRRAQDCEPEILPAGGWIHDALRWHRYAHHAVQALNEGRWGQDEHEHREAAQLIDRLQRNARTIPEIYARLALRNTQALRRDFRARLTRDADEAETALREYLAERRFWTRLDEAALPGFAIRRQENQAIWAALTLRQIDTARADRLIEELDFHPWPEYGPVPSPKAIPYDTAAWIRWRSVLNFKLEDDRMASSLASIAPGVGFFPAALVPEAILRITSESKRSLRRSAAKLLRELIEGHEDIRIDHPGGILDVLLLRSQALLGLEGGDANFADVRERTCGSPPLELIRRELATLAPRQIIERCPC